MGKHMSKMVRRSAKNFNVENRAHAAIERHKLHPKPAPKYESSQREVNEIRNNFPEKFDEDKKDNNLLERLKQVRIESHGPPPEIKPKTVSPSVKPLPENRRAFDRNELGVEEPSDIPPGKLSLKQALELLVEQQTRKRNTDDVSKEFKIEPEKIEAMFEYFKPFNLHMPKKPTAANRTAAYETVLSAVRDKTTLIGDSGKKESQ
ncbi:NADH dehydrogenase [ubiquinone] 1 alpha subcomplex assembly factor 4-like [Tubulanus polymorphus]|uniref:NADH dehydrogenase [ubiquinone] 1 alpha subcomplex assembly factor 4-like n=1 Tax=Tubulanus polymorphus TaxID=672921 RepID=UPI003DA5A12C